MTTRKNPPTQALAPLTPQTQAIVAPKVSDFKAMLEENYGDENAQPEFPRIKFPTSGAATFTVPDPEGDKPAQVLEGVILHTTTPKALWLSAFSGDTPPDCSSVDGRTGQVRMPDGSQGFVLPEWAKSLGVPGGDCVTCPYNQWGTKRDNDGKFGRGKACKDMRRLWVLRSGDLMPMIVTLPPTSLAAYEQYANKLMAKGTGIRTVLTRIQLTETKNEKGIKYQTATFAQAEKADAEMATSLREFATFITPMVKKVQVDSNDYRTVDPETGEINDAQ